MSTGTAGFDSPDATTTATEPSHDDELRFARASVAHLLDQARILDDQADAVAAKAADVIAAQQGKTAEARAIADRALDTLYAARAALAELEG